MSHTIIIGAGITGLSCAYFSKKNYTVLEKSGRAGGLCSSVKINGFTFDYSGHFLHIHKPCTKKLILKLYKDSLLKISRNAVIYTHNTSVPYPFQANTYVLDKKILNECIKGILSRPKNLKTRRGINFYQWSLGTFGKGITKYFMKPYNEKLWTVPVSRLTTDWIKPFVPKPTTTELLRGTKKPQSRNFGYNSYFYYPKKGGCKAITDAFLKKVNNVRYKVYPKTIDIKNKLIHLNDGRRLKYDNMISTQPLNELIKSIPGAPLKIKRLAGKLRANKVYCINLGIKPSLDNPNRHNSHWIYYPQKTFNFYRTGIYSNVNRLMAPENCYSLYVEVSFPSSRKINRQNLLNKTISNLKKAGIVIKSDKIIAKNILEIPCAYVIYDKNHKKSVAAILNYLKSHGIRSIGRYGAWKYSFMEESILDAKKTVEEIKNK